MHASPPPANRITTDPTPAQALAASALAELTAIGLDMARTVNQITKVEQRAVAAAARWLPDADAVATSLAQATEIGQGIDAATEALAEAGPRVTTLTKDFDRIARAVRRTLALARRIEQGWPRSSAADDRRTLRLRQVAHGVRETIRRHVNGDEEARERLFADLSAHLDDPEFLATLPEGPIEDIIRHVCRVLGFILEDKPGATVAAATPTGPPPPHG